MTASDTDTCVHREDKANPGFCRKCGAPMPGSEDAIAAVFEAAPPAAAAAGTGAACLRCGAEMTVGDKCCEACGLPVTWTGSTPHQERPPFGQRPAGGPSVVLPAAAGGPVGPTSVLADPDLRPAAGTAGDATGTGRIKLIVRVNRDIHDRAAHPEYKAPYDLGAYTFEIDGPRAELGRPTGEPLHDQAPNRILAQDEAVSGEHATFERLADGTWEIRDHSRNGTRLNRSKLTHHDPSEPAGSGVTLKVGDVIWAGYYTEIEVTFLS